MLQFYYPSVAVSLLLGNVATSVYLGTGISAVDLDSTTWFMLWSATLVTWFSMLLWLRRFNIATHEREEIGVPGMGLALFCGPVYVAAGLAAVLRRKLAFVVTAKGAMRTTESLSTFKLHLLWFGFAAVTLAASFYGQHDYTLLRIWAGLTLLMGIAPPIAAWVSGLLDKQHPEREAPSIAEWLDDTAPPTVVMTVPENITFVELPRTQALARPVVVPGLRNGRDPRDRQHQQPAPWPTPTRRQPQQPVRQQRHRPQQQVPDWQQQRPAPQQPQPMPPRQQPQQPGWEHQRPGGWQHQEPPEGPRRAPKHGEHPYDHHQQETW